MKYNKNSQNLFLFFLAFAVNEDLAGNFWSSLVSSMANFKGEAITGSVNPDLFFCASAAVEDLEVKKSSVESFTAHTSGVETTGRDNPSLGSLESSGIDTTGRYNPGLGSFVLSFETFGVVTELCSFKFGRFTVTPSDSPVQLLFFLP